MCGPDPCLNNERLLESGECEQCAAFTKVSEDRLTCENPTCHGEGREFLLPNGECKICPEFHRLGEDRQCCFRPICPIRRQTINREGYCVFCSGRPDPDHLDQCYAGGQLDKITGVEKIDRGDEHCYDNDEIEYHITDDYEGRV